MSPLPIRTHKGTLEQVSRTLKDYTSGTVERQCPSWAEEGRQRFYLGLVGSLITNRQGRENLTPGERTLE